MRKLLTAAKQLVVREDGPTMVEYALMVALIAVVAIVAVKALGVEVTAIFSGISTSLAGA